MKHPLTRSEIEREIANRSCWSFPRELESRYMERCGRSVTGHIGRSAAIAGVLTFAAIGLDLSVSREVFVATWPWRCFVAALCLIVSTYALNSSNAQAVGLAYGLTLLCILGVIEYAGFWGTQDIRNNYSLAAIVIFSVATAAAPIAFPVVLLAGCLAVVVYSSLALIFDADGNTSVTDLIISLGAMVAMLAASRSNEINRRQTFLQTLRYELAATELSVVNQELLRLSNTDALTGLPNRRYFEAEAARLCVESTSGSIGAILMDVDHFKKFNDAAGHVAGDMCLRAVAQALARSTSGSRIKIARYGGEEFAAIVPSVVPRELEDFCEELRAAVSSLNLPHPGCPDQNVSISAGMAWRANCDRNTPQSLLAEADAALYAAKAKGRNRIAWTTPKERARGFITAFDPFVFGRPGLGDHREGSTAASKEAKAVTGSELISSR